MRTFRLAIRLIGTASLLVVTGSCAPRTAGPRPRPEASETRRVTILAVNDVYRIEGVEGGARGGFARLRTLRRQLEEDGPVLVLHAGDFLAPSFLSRIFRGEQMVDVMNRLDGDAEAFDPRMFVTFGNHEFDGRELEDAAVLDQRIGESGFGWLHTNVTFGRGVDGTPLVEDPHLAATVIVPGAGGMPVGLFSITTDVSRPAYVADFGSPAEAARRATADLRAVGCDVVVALTHLELSEDRALLQALGDDGPDLVIGGHDHEGSETLVGGRYILKADADLRTATVAVVEVGADGLRVTPRRVRLDERIAPDRELASVVDAWVARHALTFCARAKLADGCLDEPLSRAGVLLQAEELQIRRFETNLGDWVADVARDAYAARGAQGAFLNAGGLRLNQDLPEGTVITRRHLEELFAYPAPLRLIAIDGRTLQQVIERSVEDWTGNGWWLQVSGFAFRHDPDTGRVSDLTLLAPEGPRPVRPDETIRLVTVDFLVNPKWGQDGYTMLSPQQIVEGGEGAPDLKDLVAAALRGAGPGGIAPERAGRICNPRLPGPCLAVSR